MFPPLILKEHEPIDPMRFFLRAIHRVKGAYREEVREPVDGIQSCRGG